MKKINNDLRPYVARLVQDLMPGVPKKFFSIRQIRSLMALSKFDRAMDWIKANPEFVALVQRVAQYYPKSSISLAWELYRWDATGLVEAGIAAREAVAYQERLIAAKLDIVRAQMQARAMRDSSFEKAMESMS